MYADGAAGVALQKPLPSLASRCSLLGCMPVGWASVGRGASRCPGCIDEGATSGAGADAPRGRGALPGTRVRRVVTFSHPYQVHVIVSPSQRNSMRPGGAQPSLCE
jgi:hypothetical protein